MLLSIRTNNGQRLPLLAPLGAAAYAIKEAKAANGTHSLSILFAMMKPGETGLQAINRLARDKVCPKGGWIAVDPRPALQTMASPSQDAFVAYDFLSKDGIWTPERPEASAFLDQVTRIASSTVAPAALATDPAKWTSPS